MSTAHISVGVACRPTCLGFTSPQLCTSFAATARCRKSKGEFSKAFEAKRHIYDYVFTDSRQEQAFVEELDTSAEVVVYAKLPRGFTIPTPVGNYNPDWAIAFKKGSVKHVYFVAETKGSMSSLQLREIERQKIRCARKFFSRISHDQVKYDVITDYQALLNLVC